MANPLQQAKEMAAYNNSLALSNAKQAQRFNAQEAQKNRDWQERMSNSAHQREIADLKKAGLNPVLSITGGNGASVTSGSQASGSAAPVDTSVTDGIINMAIAQMNNATTMQRVAMETQNAMAIASMNNANSWREHITPGGSTAVGQVLYGMEMLGLLPNSATATGISREQLLKNQKKYSKALNSSGGTDIDDLLAELQADTPARRVSAASKKNRNKVKRSNKNSKKSGYLDRYGSAGSIFRRLFT